MFTGELDSSHSDTDGVQVLSASTLSNPARITDTYNNAMSNPALPDTLNSHQSGQTVDGSQSLPIAIESLAFTSSGPYRAGDVITLQATFSKFITIGSGTAASIPLTIGSNTRNATAAAAATASITHNFTYTVVSGDADTDGIQVLSSATITNTARFDAVSVFRHGLNRPAG